MQGATPTFIGFLMQGALKYGFYEFFKDSLAQHGGAGEGGKLPIPQMMLAASAAEVSLSLSLSLPLSLSSLSLSLHPPLSLSLVRVQPHGEYGETSVWMLEYVDMNTLMCSIL